ncbi:glutamate receptor 2-like [Homarus americanus]|uniref:glutamate receptor 2-like n=1 Tax=Homarus americanus TaxID=6706 RepID=UPI001C4772CC|nr:glutamate receptor 2-like [Homarus americanus]
MLLKTIAHALNFTFRVLPVSSWDQVTGLVTGRESLMATVYHTILPQRSLLYDYTYAYEHVFMHFTMAKPLLSSNWQSLYDPLADEVWVSILVVLFLVSLLLYTIARLAHRRQFDNKINAGDAAHIAIGTLLAQSVNKYLLSSSSQVLVAAWLVFAFIVGTAYRGNLTAALTLPKYPPRPETLEQLVRVADKVTMAPYGEEFRQFFKQSDSGVFQALSDIMEIVPTAAQGLRRASEERESYMDGRRYLEQMIADHFTRVDGSTQMYVGRESVLPALGAWPIPHDAPYKPHLDKLMLYIVESGLYEKWMEDMLSKARQDSRGRKREYQKKQGQEVVAVQEGDKRNQALTLVHMQGPFILLLLGLSLSCSIILTEFVITLFRKETIKY